MSSINFNYNQAISQANQIEGIANEMLRLASNNFRNTIDSIGASWKGEAAQQFLGYCAKTQGDIEAQARSLQSIAGRIRDVARNIKEAEERAKALMSRQNAESGGSSTGRL